MPSRARVRIAALTLCLVVLTAVVIRLLTAGRVDRSRTYSIGYELNPPFQYIGKDGRLTGIAVDTMNAAARRASLTIRWVHSPRNSGEALRGRHVDLWPWMAALPERRSYVYVSDPVATSDFYLLAEGQTTRPPPSGFIGEIYFSGAELHRSLASRVWPRAELVACSAANELPSLMCAGKMPRVFISAHQANILLRNVVATCPDVPFRAHHLPSLTVRLGVGAIPELSPVADLLRAEMVRMAGDGELGGILARYAYLGLTEAKLLLQLTEAERQSRVLVSSLSALGIALLVLLWTAWRLRRARKSAEAANRAKGHFLANMSHEIRTPIGGVIGMVELALETPLNADQREYLQTAHSCARTLLSLLNDILDFSRIEAKRLDITATIFELRPLVQEVAALMGTAAGQKGLRLDVVVDPSAPASVEADPLRVRQVLLNLIGNAVKFTEKGAIAVRVETGQIDQLIFRVSDTGIGVAPANQELIFHAFRQADGSTARRFGGSGLGLAISRQLVELMGGRLWVESMPGQGSTFSFTIHAPDARPSDGKAQTLAPEEPEAPASMRILVAEDNSVNQLLLKTILEREGHSATVVENGVMAVDLAAQAPPFDLILMDIQMPEMDGFEATTAIRALRDPVRSAVPVVALTAHAQVGYDQICRQQGMDGYLSKPIDRARLRRILAEMAPRELQSAHRRE